MSDIFLSLGQLIKPLIKHAAVQFSLTSPVVLNFFDFLTKQLQSNYGKADEELFHSQANNTYMKTQCRKLKYCLSYYVYQLTFIVHHIVLHYSIGFIVSVQDRTCEPQTKPMYGIVIAWLGILNILKCFWIQYGAEKI